MASWHVFSGKKEPHRPVLPEPPPWRDFQTHSASPAAANVSHCDYDAKYWERARHYRTPDSILDAVNAALALRRPLLVTGRPGAGKSSLIYRVAYELCLGPVLVWPVNSRSTINEGLYDYDAIARLQDKQLRRSKAVAGPRLMQAGRASQGDIGRYITLRALGTALLPWQTPRALLIDELDKADPDLPNDLLNIFEEGWFEIPELQRYERADVEVRISDPMANETQNTSRAMISRGRVQCSAFPFIVMTSNGEREFPQAFQRRCIRVDLPLPGETEIDRIVAAHFNVSTDHAAEFIETYLASDQSIATDQLLNALHIVHAVNGLDDDEKNRIRDLLMRPLG